MDKVGEVKRIEFKTRRELYDFVDTLYLTLRNELKFPNGENWWPLLRIRLVYRLLMVTEVNYTRLNKSYTVNDPRVQPNVWKRIKHKIDFYKIKRTTQKLMVTCDAEWCVAGFAEHYYNADEGIRNLYLSPFENLLNRQCISYEKWLFTNEAGRKTEGVLNAVYRLWLKYYRLEFNTTATRNNWFELFDRNTRIIENYLAGFGIYKDTFDCSVLTVVQREYLPHYWAFRNTLRQSGIKKIWMYSYYDFYLMMLTKAAHDCNIKVYEYQHSAQGDNHFAYSKLVGVSGALPFFPDVYVVWDNVAGKYIKENMCNEEYRPEIVEGGNLAVAEDGIKYMYKSVTASQAVLITLQGYWLPDYVENAIKESHNITWYIRFHPRYPFDREKGEALHAAFPQKVEIINSNSRSIPHLLTEVLLHVTDSSGGALEAEYFFTPTLIIGKNGTITYATQIQRKTMHEALDAVTFNKLLQQRVDLNKTQSWQETIELHTQQYNKIQNIIRLL